jgi:predicted enzyme related to lactoylglutathione lyase
LGAQSKAALLAAHFTEKFVLMKIDNAIASVPVKNLKAASSWYEKLFRRPTDSTPMPEVAEWKFPRGGWLQVYQLPERAGNGSCTLAVGNLEEVIAHLESLGIDTSQRTSGEKAKTVMITDPDGNHLAFAETIDRTMAH